MRPPAPSRAFRSPIDKATALLSLKKKETRRRQEKARLDLNVPFLLSPFSKWSIYQCLCFFGSVFLLFLFSSSFSSKGSKYPPPASLASSQSTKKNATGEETPAAAGFDPAPTATATSTASSRPPRPQPPTTSAPASGRRHHHHHHPLPPICPILISQNVLFASEVMGARGGGSDWRGAGGVNRSLVASASPVQLRFPPYATVRKGALLFLRGQ